MTEIIRQTGKFKILDVLFVYTLTEFFVLMIAISVSILEIQPFNLSNIVFWSMITPFITVAVLYRKWALAALLALVFWLPGPIDHFWDVKVSIYSTSDLLRAFSLLDLFAIMILALPFKRSTSTLSFLPANSLIRFLLIFLVIWSFVCMLYFSFTLPIYQVPALLLGLVFIRIGLIYLLVKKYVKKFEDLWRLYWGILLGALGLIVNGMYSYMQASSLGRLSAGTFGNNIYSAFLAMCIIALFVFASVLKSVWQKLLLYIVQFACLLLIFFSGARTGLALLVLGLGIIFIVRSTLSVKWSLRLIVLFLIAILGLGTLVSMSQSFGFAGVDRIVRFVQIIADSSSIQDVANELNTVSSRIEFWNFALYELVRNPLLGIGPGQWNYAKLYAVSSKVSEPYGQPDLVTDPHNGYIHIAVEFGLPAFMVFMIFVSILLYTSLAGVILAKAKFQRRQLSISQFHLFTGLAVVTILWVTLEMMNSVITKLYNQYFVGIFIFGLLTAGQLINKHHGEVE